jgi:hypothetical protein
MSEITTMHQPMSTEGATDMARRYYYDEDDHLVRRETTDSEVDDAVSRDQELRAKERGEDYDPTAIRDSHDEYLRHCKQFNITPTR